MSTPAHASLPASYFDAVYDASTDPWDFETSAYEADKYRETVAALGDRRFRHGFEIGCSIGVLSMMLGSRCERLLSVDASDAPLARARERLSASPGPKPDIDFRRLQVPDEFPAGHFDLVVLSEVAYYWSRTDLGRAFDGIERVLDTGGVLLMVHWTPPVHDYPLRGDEVHDAMLERAGPAGPFAHVRGFRRETWRLDLFEKR